MTTVGHHRDQGRYPKGHAIYIGRPSKWGNPYRIKQGVSREQAIAQFKQYWYSERGRPLREAAVQELKDKVLVCYCHPQPCHGDVIAEYLNVEVPL